MGIRKPAIFFDGGLFSLVSFLGQYLPYAASGTLFCTVGYQ
jgi:hypothetical protein